MAEDNKDQLEPVNSPVGQVGLILTNTFVSENKKEDMQMPKRLCVFDEMAADPAVKAPLDRTALPIFKALMMGKWVGSGSKRSEVLADFMNTVVHTMPDQMWSEFCANAITDTRYGFSLAEIVPTIMKKGAYKGALGLGQLAPRAQKSIYAWVWDDNFSKVIGYVQKPRLKRWEDLDDEFASYLGGVSDLSVLRSQYKDHKFPIISTKQSLHFKWGSFNNNPEGESALEACYSPWKEKSVISKYQVIGISRDFGGVPILRLPPELIANANDPDNRYPSEKQIYDQYIQQMRDMHAGEQAGVVLSSEINEQSGNTYEYDLKLMGVEGGGKQFDISQIVQQKNQDIANAFLAGHLLLGQQGNTSSYNASTAGAANNSLTIEKAIMEKIDVLTHQLVIPLLQANDRFFTHKDLPVFKYKDPDQITLDDAGKFLQRVKSVGALTEELARFVYNLIDAPTEGLELLDFTGEDQSRGGESQGSSGTGNSQGGGKSSTMNTENKSMEEVKNFCVDPHGDGTGALLDKDGNVISMVNINE